MNGMVPVQWLTWCHSWAPSISCMASRASSSKSCDPPDSDSVREGGLRSPLARLAASSSSSSPAHAHKSADAARGDAQIDRLLIGSLHYLDVTH